MLLSKGPLVPTNEELSFLNKNETRINQTIIFALELLSAHYHALNDPRYVLGKTRPLDILTQTEISKLRTIQDKLIESAKRNAFIDGPK